LYVTITVCTYELPNACRNNQVININFVFEYTHSEMAPSKGKGGVILGGVGSALSVSDVYNVAAKKGRVALDTATLEKLAKGDSSKSGPDDAVEHPQEKGEGSSEGVTTVRRFLLTANAVRQHQLDVVGIGFLCVVADDLKCPWVFKDFDFMSWCFR
jgi:hypothetical protein